MAEKSPLRPGRQPDRNALFNAWNALANLADVGGEVSINAKAKQQSGFDKSILENGVPRAAKGTRADR